MASQEQKDYERDMELEYMRDQMPDSEDITDKDIREVLGEPTDIDYLIENKECVACKYHPEDINWGEHCAPCSLPIDAEDYSCHFEEEDRNTIIDRVTEENQGVE